MKFKVTMHCASCAANIEKTLRKKLDIKSESNPALKITKIIENPNNVTDEEIIKVIGSIGYEARKA